MRNNFSWLSICVLALWGVLAHAQAAPGEAGLQAAAEEPAAVEQVVEPAVPTPAAEEAVGDEVPQPAPDAVQESDVVPEPTTAPVDEPSAEEPATPAQEVSPPVQEETLASPPPPPAAQQEQVAPSPAAVEVPAAPKKEEPATLAQKVSPPVQEETPALPPPPPSAQQEQVVSSPVAVEAPAAPKKVDEPDEEGIDTIDIASGGNWLLKRIWWERAQETFEKIKALMEQVFDFRMQFFAQRNEIDKSLTSFYLATGFDQGELEEVVDDLLQELSDDKQEEGRLKGKKRDVFLGLQDRKQDLEQLKFDVSSITELDGAIDEALQTLIEQINRCRQYEHQAWQKFKEIAQELDDEKAKELYYHMESLFQNIQEIFAYLRGAYAQHFQETLGTAKSQVEQVKSRLAHFKEEGVELEGQLTQLRQTEQEEDLEEEEEDAVPAQRKPAGFVQKITGFFGQLLQTISSTLYSLWSMLRDALGALYSKLFGQKVVPVSPEETGEEPEEEVTELVSEQVAETQEPERPAAPLPAPPAPPEPAPVGA